MRTLSVALDTALIQPLVHLVYLVRIDFDAGVVAWNSGYRDISYAAINYIASGALGSISSIKEEPGVKASGITITISGIKPEIVALALTEPYLGRKCWVYCAVVDAAGVFDPNKIVLLFYGKLDAISGNIGKSASFSVNVRSRLSDWERSRVLRYSDADQQKLYPGDRGMEYIPQLSTKKIIWPKAAFLPDPRD
ncbi:MAG: hypothetical protein H7Y05_14205 [Steroidobacteraceae bacterium]|nr:hypothetical protein [Deltaproteobacteria bacterium]